MDELKKYLQNNREQIDTDLPGDGLWKGVKNTLHPPARVPVFAKWAAAACLVLAIGTGIYFITRSSKPSGELAHVPNGTDTGIATRPFTPLEIATGVVKENAEKIFALGRGIRNARTAATPAPLQPLPNVTVVAYMKKQQKTNKKRLMKKEPRNYGFEEIEASYATMLGIQLERLRTQPIYAEGPEYFHLFKTQFAGLVKDEERIKQQLRKNSYDSELLDELITIYQRKTTVLKQLQFEINKMNNKVKQTDAGTNLQKPSYINL